MLELQDVHADYGHGHVLRGIDMTVGEGEVVALLGRNGAGKSTALKCIMGIVRRSVGTVRFRGQNLENVPTNQICRLGMGYIPEDRRIFPNLSVAENLQMGFFQTPGLTDKARKIRVDELFEWFPRLRERRMQAGNTLSGGEQQMLAFARGLAGGPRLLLIDEPSEGLAPMVVDEIFAAITRVKAQGIAVLLVEQNVRRALQVSDRAYVVEKGQTVACGPAARMLDDEQVRQRLSV